jgi:hypothetical protein
VGGCKRVLEREGKNRGQKKKKKKKKKKKRRGGGMERELLAAMTNLVRACCRA